MSKPDPASLHCNASLGMSREIFGDVFTGIIIIIAAKYTIIFVELTGFVFVLIKLLCHERLFASILLNVDFIQTVLINYN